MDDFKIEYFSCECFSQEHTLQFVIEEEDGTIHASTFLNQYRGFLRRSWVAVKYIFNYKCKYGHWDTFILRSEDVPRFKKMLDMISQDK